MRRYYSPWSSVGRRCPRLGRGRSGQSVDFQIELANERAPFRLLAVDVLGVFLRRRCQGIAALRLDAPLDGFGLDQRAQRCIEAVDDGAWGSCRGEQTIV